MGGASAGAVVAAGSVLQRPVDTPLHCCHPLSVATGSCQDATGFRTAPGPAQGQRLLSRWGYYPCLACAGEWGLPLPSHQRCGGLLHPHTVGPISAHSSLPTPTHQSFGLCRLQLTHSLSSYLLSCGLPLGRTQGTSRFKEWSQFAVPFTPFCCAVRRWCPHVAGGLLWACIQRQPSPPPRHRPHAVSFHHHHSYGARPEGQWYIRDPLEFLPGLSELDKIAASWHK
jgi:hypothetical protein